MGKPYTNLEVSFIKENYVKFGAKYCSQKLCRPYQSLIYKANSLGIKQSYEEKLNIHKDSKIKPNNWYKINPEQFYNIKNPEVCYFLGHLWADGCVGFYFDKNHKSPLYRLSLSTKISDFNDYKKYLDKLGTWCVSYRNYKNKIKNYKGENCVSISTGNKPLSIYLIEHDFDKKSLVAPIKIFSKIPENLKHYFWRGYFDGDGYISGEDGHHNEMAFCGSYNQDWSEHIKLLDYLNIKYRISKSKNTKGKSSEIRVYGIDNIYKFGNYIYNNRENDNIGLSRKYGRWLKIKNKFLQKQSPVITEYLTVERPPLSCNSVFDMISKYDGLLTRKTLSQFFNVKNYNIDYIIKKLTIDNKIYAIGKLGYRKYFIKKCLN